MAVVSAGPIVLSSDVESAIRDTMKQWVPFYLADIDAQQGRARGTTKAPRTWDIASDNATRWLEETPPSLLVACPGTIGEPQLHGDNATYGCWWQGNIGIAVGGATEAGSRALAGRHAGAVTYVLAQQGDMGGLAQITRWSGSRTDVAGRDRSVVACEIAFRLYVETVVATRGLIPRDLPDDPITLPHATPTVIRSRVRVTGRP